MTVNTNFTVVTGSDGAYAKLLSPFAGKTIENLTIVVNSVLTGDKDLKIFLSNWLEDNDTVTIKNIVIADFVAMSGFPLDTLIDRKGLINGVLASSSGTATDCYWEVDTYPIYEGFTFDHFLTGLYPAILEKYRQDAA